MPRCACCGTSNPVGEAICAHHLRPEVDWAAANRIFCDFVHRGIEPPAVPLELAFPYETFELVGEEATA
jgi:hypothetical protein